MTAFLNRSFRFASIGTALIFVCLCATGCGAKVDPPAVVPDPPRVTLKVEARPADSPELSRTHKFDELNREFEVEIAYRDKSKGTEILNRESGVVVEFTRTVPGADTLQQHCKYNKKGALVWEELYHSNGKVRQRRQWQTNGDRELQQFVTDGTSEIQRALIRKNGSGEWIQRLQDPLSGKVKGIYQKYIWQANGDFVREEYDYQTSSFLLWRAVGTGDALVVDALRADQSLEFRHYHKATIQDAAQGSFRPPWTLEKSEVFDVDGKTVKRTFFYRGNAAEVHFPLPGGGKRVVETISAINRMRFGRLDITVKGEKVYDAAGKLVSEQQGATSADLRDLSPVQDYMLSQFRYLPRDPKTQMEPLFDAR